MNFLWGGMIIAGIIFGALNGTMQEVSEAALSSAREAVNLCITMAGVMALWVGLMKIAQESGIIAGLTRLMAPFIRFMFPNIPPDHPAREYISTNTILNFIGAGWAATPAGLKAMEALADLEEERREEAGDAAEQVPGRHPTERESTPRAGGRDVRKPGAVHGTADRNTQKPREACAMQRAAGAGRRRKTHAMPRGTASSEMCTFLILNISSLQLIPVNVIAWRAQYGSVNPTAVVGPGIVATAVSTLAAVVFCKVMGRKR